MEFVTILSWYGMEFCIIAWGPDLNMHMHTYTHFQ